jgi:hypothetical protein
MKNITVHVHLRWLLLVFAFCIWSSNTYAESCQATGKVTQVHQYTDGVIFINVDQASTCDCPQKSRFAFHKLDDEKFYISAALTALTTGKRVTLIGEDGNGRCPVHGNSPKLTALYLNAN